MQVPLKATRISDVITQEELEQAAVRQQFAEPLLELYQRFKRGVPVEPGRYAVRNLPIDDPFRPIVDSDITESPTGIELIDRHFADVNQVVAAAHSNGSGR